MQRPNLYAAVLAVETEPCSGPVVMTVEVGEALLVDRVHGRVLVSFRDGPYIAQAKFRRSPRTDSFVCTGLVAAVRLPAELEHSMARSAAKYLVRNAAKLESALPRHRR